MIARAAVLSIAASVAIVIAAAAVACQKRDRLPIALGEARKLRAAKGIEVVEAPLLRGETESGRLVALFIDPKEITPSLAINSKEDDLAKIEPGALAVVNAGFYTPDRKATGLLVSEGRVLSPFVKSAGGAGSGVFVLEGETPALIPRDDLKQRAWDAVTLAIQAGPRIIEPSGAKGIRSDDGVRANRTAIGSDGRGFIAVVVIVGPDGWDTGPTLFEAQDLLGERGLGKIAPDLALKFALNLDGGPSTGLHVRTPDYRLDLPESAPVHSVLALRAKR